MIPFRSGRVQTAEVVIVRDIINRIILPFPKLHLLNYNFQVYINFIQYFEKCTINLYKQH